MSTTFNIPITSVCFHRCISWKTFISKN